MTPRILIFLVTGGEGRCYFVCCGFSGEGEGQRTSTRARTVSSKLFDLKQLRRFNIVKTLFQLAL